MHTLERLTELVAPEGPEEKRRPHHVSVKWGLPEFQGAIESLATTYNMFLPDGTPVRATSQLKIREASRLSLAT